MRTEIIKIDGEPRSKARPRFAHGYVYTPRETKDYEKLVTVTWGHRKKFDGPVRVTIRAYFKIPQSATKAKREMMINGDIIPVKKPDCDNIAKIILDGLNGHAFVDDYQVAELSVVKRYAAQPCVEVEIQEIVL